MIIGRLLAGIGIGISPAIVPMYICEEKIFDEAEKTIKTLYIEGKVIEVMADLSASGQGSEVQNACWFDLFRVASDVAASTLVGATNVFGQTTLSRLSF
nr:plastidic glucose transporter 4 [Tanacetum cinerariifolium]